MQWVRPAGDVTQFAKPRDWDEEKMGPCGTLPVRREIDGYLNGKPFIAHFSNWKPNSDELAQLAAGHVIQLECCGVQPAVSMGVVPCADPDAGPPPRTMEAIRGAVARGWCHDRNTAKEMDSDLAEAIAAEVANLFGAAAAFPPSPTGG